MKKYKNRCLRLIKKLDFRHLFDFHQLSTYIPSPFSSDQPNILIAEPISQSGQFFNFSMFHQEYSMPPHSSSQPPQSIIHQPLQPHSPISISISISSHLISSFESSTKTNPPRPFFLSRYPNPPNPNARSNTHRILLPFLLHPGPLTFLQFGVRENKTYNAGVSSSSRSKTTHIPHSRSVGTRKDAASTNGQKCPTSLVNPSRGRVTRHQQYLFGEKEERLSDGMGLER